jgi:peptidoglycan hydrolase-like protein with peptidoglycan-binding domain
MRRSYIFFALLIFLIPLFHTTIVSGAYTCITLTEDMQKGYKEASTTKEVTKLRAFLKEDKDFATNTIDPVGVFGENTRKAVIVFQKKNKISPTGNIGRTTRAKIKELSCSTSSPSTMKSGPGSSLSATTTKPSVTTTVVSQEVAKLPVVTDVPTIYVKTFLASDVTASSSVLNGVGGVDGEKHWFQWGKTMEMKEVTPQIATGTTYSQKITGLSPNTIYYFRAASSVASSSERKAEVAYGEMRNFTTPSAPAVAAPTPTVSISSKGTAINSTGSTRITWTSTNTNVCEFTGGEDGGTWTSLRALSGEYLTMPITRSTTFYISCRNIAGYTVTSSVSVAKITN